MDFSDSLNEAVCASPPDVRLGLRNGFGLACSIPMQTKVPILSFGHWLRIGRDDEKIGHFNLGHYIKGHI
jgi:hypothetical protein